MPKMPKDWEAASGLEARRGPQRGNHQVRGPLSESPSHKPHADPRMTDANSTQFIFINNLSPYQAHYQTVRAHGRSAGTVPPASTEGVPPPTTIIHADASNPITSFEVRTIGGSGVGSIYYPAPAKFCATFEIRPDGTVQRYPCVRGPGPSGGAAAAPRPVGFGIASSGASAAGPGAPGVWSQSLFLANRTGAPITVNTWYADGTSETATVPVGLTRIWTSSGPDSLPPTRRMVNYAVSTAHWGTGMLPVPDMACISLAATDHGLVHNSDGPADCHDGGDGMGGAGFNPSGRGMPHIM
jgi:hypothetical protein